MSFGKFVADCVRSNLRASKLKIFLGGGGTPPDPLVGFTRYYHPAVSHPPPQLKILFETLLMLLPTKLQPLACTYNKYACSGCPSWLPFISTIFQAKAGCQIVLTVPHAALSYSTKLPCPKTYGTTYAI